MRPRSKLEVLSCLSETVQSDLIEEVEHRVSRACRQELRFELLQKHDDIHLNPKLVRPQKLFQSPVFDAQKNS